MTGLGLPSPSSVVVFSLAVVVAVSVVMSSKSTSPERVVSRITFNVTVSMCMVLRRVNGSHSYPTSTPKPVDVSSPFISRTPNPSLTRPSRWYNSNKVRACVIARARSDIAVVVWDKCGMGTDNEDNEEDEDDDEMLVVRRV